jgi:hypothetical protein
MAKMYAEIRCNRRDWNLRIATIRLLSSQLDIRYPSIYKAYGRPSSFKVSAFQDCSELADIILKYFKANSNWNICIESTEGVCSRNAQLFTYGCNYYVDYNLVGKLYVTKTSATLSICEDYLQSFCDTFGVKI